MANAAQAPKIQLGKLTPEDAERLASTFRPVWDLDDAPFTSNGAQGNGLSAADIDALGAGAGIAPSVRTTEALQARPPQPEVSTVVTGTTEIKSVPGGHVPAMHDPKVEIAIEVDAEPEPTPPPVAQAQPQPVAAPAARPYTPPRAPPPTVRVNRDAAGSGEFVPVKKSNTGIIVGAVGVVVVIGAIFGIRAAMSGDKPQTTTSSTSTTTATHEEAHIPPPPDTATIAAQAPTQTAQTAQATQPQATQAATQTAPQPTHQTTATNVTAPVHTAAAGGGHTTTTHTTGGGGTKPAGHANIVRDNPF